MTLAACTSNEPGEPRAEQGVTSTDTPRATTSSTSAPQVTAAQPTVEIPPRPKDLDISSVAPCSLITKAKLDEWKAVREPRPRTTTGQRKAPACVFELGEGNSAYSVTMVLDANEGIEAWLTGKRTVDAKLVSVDGYPAVHYWPSGPEGSPSVLCNTTVGVADGQQLSVEQPGPRRGLSQDELCADTDRVALAALTTLRG
ncbi:MAG: DUF3558 domain-containing protein [Actinomycetota bacterium]|nr:DUF3558 domain-containing protein [Actinomycetota bacterium]